MKYKILLTAALLLASLTAQAEWFLRGTHNGWNATQMNIATAKSVELDNVVFSTAGYIKFDRFGDWYENYGLGGSYGANIPIAAGTWRITFFTDTKKWQIKPAPKYHLRANFNQWKEGTLLTRNDTTDTYSYCYNYNSGFGVGSLQFKIDPNGGWGGDEQPASNYIVTTPGWVNIMYNASTKKITTETNLPENCDKNARINAAQIIALYQAPLCDKNMRTTTAINSTAELNAFFNASNGGTIPSFPAPNFSTHSLLVVYNGEKPTTGYGLQMISHQYDSITDQWIVWMQETTPPSDSIQAQVITSPCIMLQVPRTPTNAVDVKFATTTTQPIF